MKSTKKIISLALALALVFAMAIPAAALDTEWRQEFRKQFPTLSQGSSKTGYVYALQRFLSVHTSSSSTLASAGGVDGAYGTGTANAVKKFQTYGANYLIPGMDVDGIVGGDTWACVAIELTEYSGGYLKYGSSPVLWSSSGSIYYLNNSGTYTYFHTIVGDVEY